MNDVRYKLNRQAIDRKWEDGQERDLLAEINLLKLGKEKAENELFDMHIKTDEEIARLNKELDDAISTAREYLKESRQKDAEIARLRELALVDKDFKEG